MSRLGRFIKRDLSHIKGNVIALVVIVGIICVPTFYAWFNIAGSWDPYGNTKNLKVAVANADAGYTSELMPVELNIGERVVADLRESESIGYTVVSEEEALEGVRSGEYYAAVVIPENFSEAMMGALSSNPEKAEVKFYQNEKANAIAEIVTNKASTAIQADIDASFASTITSVGVGVLDELGTYLDDDQVAEVASKLDQAVADSTETLSGTATQMRNFASLVEAAEGLLGAGTGTTASSLSSSLDLGGTLRESASGVRTIGSALDGTTEAINSALSSSASSLDSVQQAIDNAFDTAGGQVDSLVEGLDTVNAAVGERIGDLNTISEKLGTLYDLLYYQLMPSIESQYGDASEAYLTVKHLAYVIHDPELNEGLWDTLQNLIAELTELSNQLTQTSADLTNGKADTETSRAELAQLVASAKAGVATVQSDYESNVKGSLSGLAGLIDSAANDADSITSSLNSTLGSVKSTTSSASASLESAKVSLNEAATTLDSAATKLTNLHTNLRAALDSGDLDQVRAILSSDPDDLASFISSPVSVDRNAIYPIENNGSAMAPFYTVLAIWIGGVVLAALVKANPSEAALEETGCGHTAGYVGRLALFCGVGFLQSALICAGDLYYLGCQCEHPFLFFLAGWVASFTFINIIYALTASFGDVGKAIAVVFMVVQVAGSGGTFPKEMLPGAFQAVYPYLPFVHAENAMRAAMFGLYGNDYWTCLATLLAFVVPSLLLGLVLRRPIIGLNEWFERKLESTKVM